MKWFLLKASSIVGGGGLIFGYDIGVISTTITSMKSSIPMTPLEEGMVVGIIGAGSVIGALIGGPLCDDIGRWKTIQIQNVLFCVGSLITAVAANVSTLCLGRFIVGLASAVSAIADVPYLTEISPSAYRGQVASVYEIMISLGVLLSFVCGYFLSSVDGGWRIAFILPLFFALIQSLSMCFLPESPKWLLEKNRPAAAKRALFEMYGDALEVMILDCMQSEPSMELEMTNLHLKVSSGMHTNYDDTDWAAARGDAPVKQTSGVNSKRSGNGNGDDDDDGDGNGDDGDGDGDVDGNGDGDGDSEEEKWTDDVAQYCRLVVRNRVHAEGARAQAGGGNPEGSDSRTRSRALREFELMWPWRYPLLIVALLQASSQLSGGVVIRNYADSLFQMNGASERSALDFTLSLAFMKLIFTLATVSVLETVGRKNLFIAGAVVVGFGMLILTIAAAATTSDFNVYVQAVALGLVVGGYGVGYGPVIWILASEMFPVLLRGKVMALSLVSQNIFLLLTNLLFLVMLRAVEPAWTFAFFLVMNVLTAVAVLLFLRETKEKLPEAILLDLNMQYQKVMSWELSPVEQYSTIQ